MTITLNDLPDDLLIYAIAFLSVPDILFLRQTCTRFNALTRLEIVWINAFELNILSNDYPCPVDDTDLEQRTCYAYRLASRWLADSPLTPTSVIKFTGSPRRSLTVLSIWDIARAHKCSEWSPKGGKLFTKIILNEDPESEVSMVVALDGSQRMLLLLHLDDDGTLHEIHAIGIGLHPISMTGDIIALSDRISKTTIYNWKTEERAYLDEGGAMQHNRCIHVVFAPTSVVVVRAHTISAYASPPLFGQTNTPIVTNPFDEFGRTSTTPTSLLILSEMYRPRTLEPNLFQLYSLASVPPTLLSERLSRHRVLSYVGIVLGQRGTAVWISPEECATVEHRGCKTLVTAVFPGSLNPTAQVRIHELCSHAPKNCQWTAFDYDEELGRIALGSWLGEVTILQLLSQIYRIRSQVSVYPSTAEVRPPSVWCLPVPDRLPLPYQAGIFCLSIFAGVFCNWGSL
ncbi:uncharacterized protein EV420DRAFT_1670245 [Desarmillaria tabescens]|uniref:F-box domain-containing protein n=1 Tax=Armillaria tabescens TaxID=1929756 RepID=A0AA39J6P0_ARMTA|nr:uncharacterized protein EV420DRAFT_1670245 [Desarmillaria tabescens]KAK0437106.1 hypothetical protein EV420DRAFT_1670245 [Desarmillaria tabescens]